MFSRVRSAYFFSIVDFVLVSGGHLIDCGNKSNARLAMDVRGEVYEACVNSYEI